MPKAGVVIVDLWIPARTVCPETVEPQKLAFLSIVHYSFFVGILIQTIVSTSTFSNISAFSSQLFIESNLKKINIYLLFEGRKIVEGG